MKKLPFLTFFAACLALLTYALPGWTEAAEFSRTALAGGQIWRLLSGHFAHFSADHLRWDLLVFVALGCLVELRCRRHFILCVAAGGFLISFGVWWLESQLNSYRGLSGIDSALFVYLAVDILNLSRAEGRRWPAVAAGVALFLFIAKIVFELCTDRMIFVDNSAAFSPVPLAHFIGAIVGGVCAFGSSLTAASVRRRALLPNCSYAATVSASSVTADVP